MPALEAESPSPLSSTLQIKDLAWIDEFAANVRSYVRVRLEDSVLIKMPVEAYPINQSGARLLERALRGEGIEGIAQSVGVGNHPERMAQIDAFFRDVRDLLSGRLGDGKGRLGTSVSRFEDSFTRYPILSELALTYRCNQACRFCYAGCAPQATPASAATEMTHAEVLRCIDRIAIDAKVPSISFTGGEPTLNPHLSEYIAHARSHQMRVNLITNGTLCADAYFVSQLKEAGLNSAQVSLEGPTAEIHEALTQKATSFERALRGIRNLQDAGIRVHTNTTLCSLNVNYTGGIVDLARLLGLERVSMNMIIPAGTPTERAHRSLQLRYSEIGESVLRARDHAAQAGLAFHWYSPTPFCLFNPIAHGLGNKGCAACDGLLHVSPSGEVLPCSSFVEGVGNMLAEGFERVWFGERAQHYKKKQMAHEHCRRCDHFSLCQGACVLYWRQMGHEELGGGVDANYF